MCHECEIREQRIVFSPRTCLNGGEPGPEQVREAKKQKEEIENPSQDQPKGGPIQGAGDSCWCPFQESLSTAVPACGLSAREEASLPV